MEKDDRKFSPKIYEVHLTLKVNSGSFNAGFFYYSKNPPYEILWEEIFPVRRFLTLRHKFNTIKNIFVKPCRVKTTLRGAALGLLGTPWSKKRANLKVYGIYIYNVGQPDYCTTAEISFYY